MQTFRLKAPKTRRPPPSRAKLMAFLAKQGLGSNHTAHLTPHRLLQMATRFGFFGRTGDTSRSFSKPKASQRLS